MKSETKIMVYEIFTVVALKVFSGIRDSVLW